LHEYYVLNAIWDSGGVAVFKLGAQEHVKKYGKILQFELATVTSHPL